MKDNLFYYLDPFVKLLLFIFFIFLCLLPFGILSTVGVFNFNNAINLSKLIAEVSSFVAIIGALLMMFKTFSYLNFETVFVKNIFNWLGFLKGSLVGVILILICTLLLYLFGFVVFKLGSITIQNFLIFFALYLFVALFEEFLFRTLPLYLFADRYPVAIAIAINSLLFSLVHFSNPNFSWLGMFNIALAGTLFCIYTLQKFDVSWAIGIHFTWNFIQGVVFGFNVSGTNTASFLIATPVGNNYLSGGMFGLEGSIFCTLILSAFIAILWYRKPIKFNPYIEEQNTD